MSDGSFDREFWEMRWTQALRDHPDIAASRPPNGYLVTETGELPPGTALDAGCGHGAEAIWLAGSGWRVTAVDFSAAALEYGRATAAAVGPEVAERIDWIEADLGTWVPTPGRFDLVSCLYVHIAGAVEDLVRRLASGVAPGGTLLMVGHRPVDPETGAPSPAAGQVQISVATVLDALDPGDWEFLVAQDRVRAAAGTGVDAVVRATRRRLSP